MYLTANRNLSVSTATAAMVTEDMAMAVTAMENMVTAMVLTDSLMSRILSMRERRQEMVDLHIHILPGIDDGAKSLREAVEMARMSAESGVRAIAATSHGDFSLYEPEEYLRTYQEKLEEFRRALAEEQIPLKVCRGMELMVNEGLLQAGKKGLLPGYGGSRSLLVEFFFDISRDRALKWTEELLDMGYRIVLAHPERYDFAKKQPEALGAFWKRGVILQVNKGSILGELGRRAARTADWLLGRGMAGAVASDAHDPVMRTPDLGEAGRVLDIYYGSDASYVLLERNPGRILEGISKT